LGLLPRKAFQAESIIRLPLVGMVCRWRHKGPVFRLAGQGSQQFRRLAEVHVEQAGVDQMCVLGLPGQFQQFLPAFSDQAFARVVFQPASIASGARSFGGTPMASRRSPSSVLSCSTSADFSAVKAGSSAMRACLSVLFLLQ
jgi:hypothetical protein